MNVRILTSLGLFTAAIVTLLSGAGCASPPKPLPIVFDAFTVTPAGADMYRLHYRGDPAASTERILDLGLASASQYLADHGMRYFAVISQEKSNLGEIHYVADETVLGKLDPKDFMVQGFPHRPKRVFCFRAGYTAHVIAEKYGLKRAEL